MAGRKREGGQDMCQRVRGHEKGDCTRRAGGGAGAQRLVAVCGGTSTAEDERVETERGAGNAGNLPSDSRSGQGGEAAGGGPLAAPPTGSHWPSPRCASHSRCRNVEMPGARASAEREKIRGRKRLHRRSPGQGGLRRGGRGLRGHSALGAQVAEWHKRRAPGRRARRRGRGGRNAHPQYAGRTQKVGSGES